MSRSAEYKSLLSLVSIGRKALIFRCPEHRATDKDR
jgi:hypothetical protein